VLRPQDPGGLNRDETTMGDMLKARGYRTMCIGKWHLGRPNEYLPTSRGFDEYFGIPYSNDMNPPVLMHNTDVIEQAADLESLTRRYTEQATKFIEASKASPFFLYMPHTFPHIPLAASAKFRGKSPRGLYGDVVEEVDWSVGEVLRILRAFRTGALCPADWAPGAATLTSEDDWLEKVFPNLAGPELESLAERAEKLSFDAGDTIVAEGDPADRFYVIARGEVSITRRSPEGDEIELETLGPAQFFGEVGILAETRRTATVRAIHDVELLALSWQEFQETLEQSDRTKRDFSEIVQERLAAKP